MKTIRSLHRFIHGRRLEVTIGSCLVLLSVIGSVIRTFLSLHACSIFTWQLTSSVFDDPVLVLIAGTNFQRTKYSPPTDRDFPWPTVNLPRPFLTVRFPSVSVVCGIRMLKLWARRNFPYLTELLFLVVWRTKQLWQHCGSMRPGSSELMVLTYSRITERCNAHLLIYPCWQSFVIQVS